MPGSAALQALAQSVPVSPGVVAAEGGSLNFEALRSAELMQVFVTSRLTDTQLRQDHW